MDNIIKNLPPIERTADNALPRMTAKQRTAATKLIRDICCNYINGNCIMLDCPCPQILTNSVCCKYFRHVLLKDKQGQSLEADLFRDNTTKQCTVCGKAFKATGNRAKYCTDCAKKVHRKQKTESEQNKRWNVDK